VAAAPRDAAIAGSCDRNRLWSVGKEGTVPPAGARRSVPSCQGPSAGESQVLSAFQLENAFTAVYQFSEVCYKLLFLTFYPNLYVFILNSVSLMFSAKHGHLLQNLQTLLVSYS